MNVFEMWKDECFNDLILDYFFKKLGASLVINAYCARFFLGIQGMYSLEIGELLLGLQNGSWRFILAFGRDKTIVLLEDHFYWHQDRQRHSCPSTENVNWLKVEKGTHLYTPFLFIMLHERSRIPFCILIA